MEFWSHWMTIYKLIGPHALHPLSSPALPAAASVVYIFKVFIEYHLNLGCGCISMFSINLTFDKTLMMQFCYFFLQKLPFLGYKRVSIQNSTWILGANSADIYCQLSVHQCAAMQQLSAKVFKLSFKYLHIYSPNVAIFADKNSKTASLMSCQRSDLRKTLKYS